MLQDMRDKVKGVTAGILVALLVLPLAFVSIGSFFLSGPDVDQAASVNGEKITQFEVEQGVALRRQQILSQFEGIDPAPVAKAAYIGVGSARKEQPAPLEDEPPEKVWQEFSALIRAYSDQSRGYTSRRAMFKEGEAGDYDQLARFGEWDATQDPVPEDLV